MPEKKVKSQSLPVKKTTRVASAKKTETKRVVAKKAPKTEKVASSLTVRLFDQLGKEKGTVALPENVFGGKVNKALMAQAVRVYLANQRMGAAVTKTRSQVALTTAKWYRQKGTGRARHGAQSAPLFVGGGTAHGPKQRDYTLDLPTKMKHAAVVSALSAMAKEGNVKVVAGLTKIEPKTKNAAAAFAGMGLSGKKALLVMPDYLETVFRATRNINKTVVARVGMLSPYEILNAGTLVIMQEALPVLEKQFGKKESKS